MATFHGNPKTGDFPAKRTVWSTNPQAPTKQVQAFSAILI
jgi:hypothetical protein